MSDANSSSATIAYNELGSYRSLSTLAVLSFVLGLLSLLSFAPTRIFLFLFPPAAVVLGLLALRQISTAPEVYTGLRLAKLGLGLALVSAVGSAGAKYMESSRIGNHGRIIADRFINKLKARDTEGAFWLKFPREGRAGYVGKNSDEIPGELLQQYGSFRAEATPVSESLANGEATVEFEAIEHTTTENGMEFAAVVYKYRSPKEDTRILVLATSYLVQDSHERSWYIREHKIGYTPNSFMQSKTTGHSHAH
jgi:hypothetical protein